MSFFKQSNILTAVCKGTVIPLEQVNDSVFSAKLLGEGFAIESPSENIYSPCDGVVEDIFDTKHAITISSKSGEKILIHMGLDTVELKGEPFTIHVTKGQKVTPKTLLATIDLEKLSQAQKDSTIIVVLPEAKKGNLLKENEQVDISDKVFKF